LTQAADISPSAVSIQPTRVADGFSAFFQTDARYYSWRGTRGTDVFNPAPGKGSQFYSPFGGGFDYQVPDFLKFQVRAQSGYVHSNHATLGQQASIDTMVDTQVTATWTFLGNENFRPFVGLAVNLPTGTTFLPGNLRFTKMDPDLVEIGSYGAGLNFNPTGGVVFAATENTAVSVSAGYSWQGSFERAALSSFECPPCLTYVPQRVYPGNIFTANINTSSIFNNVQVKTSFAYMSETFTRENNLVLGTVPVARKGPRYVANVGVTYNVDPRWKILLNGSWTYLQADTITDISFTISSGTNIVVFKEPKNSNSHLVIGMIQPTYALTDRLNVGLDYSILWRSQNYYDVTEAKFIPAKIKNSVGALLDYAVTPTASIKLRGSYFWVHIDHGAVSQIDASAGFDPPSLNYTGWTAAVIGRIQF
jgi:hypothetical protein